MGKLSPKEQDHTLEHMSQRGPGARSSNCSLLLLDVSESVQLEERAGEEERQAHPGISLVYAGASSRIDS